VSRWPAKSPAQLIVDLRDKAAAEEQNGRVDAADLMRQAAATIERLDREADGRPSAGSTAPRSRLTSCPHHKAGEFNMFRCCREDGHPGVCNWVVAHDSAGRPLKS
jgi:hypothetical protein